MKPAPVVADLALLEAFLDSLHAPFLFVDTEHVIRRMNRAAIAYYKEGESLIGRSILDCHNERSRRAMSCSCRGRGPDICPGDTVGAKGHRGRTASAVLSL